MMDGLSPLTTTGPDASEGLSVKPGLLEAVLAGFAGVFTAKELPKIS
jgi:hypothetical protein